MSKKSVLLVALISLTALALIPSARAQCKNQITLVPLTAMKAASKPRDFVRFRYPLSGSDLLLIRSHEDTETEIGPYDTGFDITQDGKTAKSVVLRKLPEFQREDADFADGYTTLAITRACSSTDSIYFISMGYEGDEVSAVLVFVLVPSEEGYEVSTLPMFHGGVLEVSTNNPLHLRAWDNLGEGECNACDTAYLITDYEIKNGKPARTRQYRTRHLYNSGNYIFDDRRRIRFIP